MSASLPAARAGHRRASLSLSLSPRGGAAGPGPSTGSPRGTGVTVSAIPETEAETDSAAASKAAAIDWATTIPLFLFPALGGLLFGFDIGISSSVLTGITSPTLSGIEWGTLDELKRGLVVSTSLFGALGGSAAALVYGDALGRKKELQLAALLFAVGATAAASAGSYSSFLVGRAVYGAGIGFAMHSAPAYIAETAPPSVRGLLISLKEALIVLGIVLGYCSGFALSQTVGGWRYELGLAVLVASILLAGMTALPESPRWTLLSGRSAEDARAQIRAIRGPRATPAAIEAELHDIQEVVRGGAGGAGGAALSITPSASGPSVGQSGALSGISLLVQTRKYWPPLYVGLSLMFFQQVTGQPSVLYYANQILSSAGFTSGTDAAASAVAIGIIKLVLTGAAVVLVDTAGRRKLLLWGVCGLVAALAALSASTGNMLPTEIAPFASLLALFLYVGSYQLSFGPVSWLIVGECFPLSVRSAALGLATLMNFGSNFLVSLLLPTIEARVGLPATFATFAVIGVFAVTSIYLTVPETKGKTLEEIEAMFLRQPGGALPASGLRGGAGIDEETGTATGGPGLRRRPDRDSLEVELLEDDAAARSGAAAPGQSGAGGVSTRASGEARRRAAGAGAHGPHGPAAPYAPPPVHEE